jgi:hypothetical protein
MGNPEMGELVQLRTPAQRHRIRLGLLCGLRLFYLAVFRHRRTDPNIPLRIDRCAGAEQARHDHEADVPRPPKAGRLTFCL